MTMHYGLVMECDYRYGSSLEDSFGDAFGMVDDAEAGGLDGVWLAERHFAAPGNPLDFQGAGIPSFVSAPLIMASAIAARTRRLRVGVAVNVLPLAHPIRVAEEAATVDQISQGRFEFGVGRSGFPRAYEGYGVPYGESRERFQECLDVILNAWTNDSFSHDGKFYKFDNLTVLPKPYQKPYPPVRIAATTRETFSLTGQDGYDIFVGLRGMNQLDLVEALKEYRQARKAAGHAAGGDVILRIPIYVADTAEQARSEPEESTWRSYRRLAESFRSSAQSQGTTASEERSERAQRLSTVGYDELLRDRLAYGTPDAVADRLRGLQEELQLSGIIAEVNVGGLIPRDKVRHSLKLFCEQVVPQLRG